MTLRGLAVPTRPPPTTLAQLITALQSTGLRVEVPIGARGGGAGPADAGMLYIEGVQTTVPTSAAYVAELAVRAARRGRRRMGGLPGSSERLATAASPRDPRYYDLTTADGIPYWQIALLHLDSVASTVLQTCAYWGNDDQCTLLRHRRHAGQRPHHRQEDARDAGRGRGRRA